MISALGSIFDFAIFLLLIWSLIHVARTRPDAFIATGKQNKRFWTLILGIPLVLSTLGVGFLQLVGLIAALVYLLDVRPAIDEILRGR